MCVCILTVESVSELRVGLFVCSTVNASLSAELAGVPLRVYSE